MALRTVQAYGRFLSRNGGKDDALKIYQEFNKAVPDHPVIVQEMKEISAGEKLPPLADSAQAGAAEALYGLGASIGRRGGEDLALIYLQLALYLEPTHAMALLSLADLYESLKKPELAIKVYDRIRAVVAASAQRRNPGRLRSRFCSIAPTRPRSGSNGSSPSIPKIPKRSWRSAISCAAARISPNAPTSTARPSATLPTPEKANWVMFYFRGICYERSKQWPSAEADLKKALELFPDQPLVLNYLGYSWVDQGTISTKA